MSVKMDGWKDIKDVGSAERLHQQNGRTREQDQSLDKRLQHAYQNFRTQKPSGKAGAKSRPPVKSDPAAAQTKSAPHLPQKAGAQPKNAAQQAQASHATAEGKKGVQEGPKIQVSNVYQQPTDPSASSRKNMPQTLAASHFVVETPKPNLAQILKSAPPTPPKAEDAKQKGEAKQAQAESEVPQALQQAAAKVSAPVTPDAGTRLADASKKEGEVGKKRGEKSEKSSENGEASAAHHAQRASHDGGALEAASSGVAGEGNEPLWIADKEPLGYTLNLDRDLSTVEEVRKRADWYRKYVEQPKTAEVLSRAVRVSEEVGRFLDEQVKKNIPAKNSYGVVRG